MPTVKAGRNEPSHLVGGGVFPAEASQERCGQLRTFVFCNFQKMEADFLAYSTKKNDIYGQLTNF